MEELITQFGSQGVLGGVIVAMGLVIRALYSDNKALRTKLDDVAEKRIGEARESVEASHKVADALNADAKETAAMAEATRALEHRLAEAIRAFQQRQRRG